MMGPRTLSFRNALSFKNIRKYRVRGPSHIGKPLGNPKEICALMMPLKAYTKGRPRISRHLHRDMLPEDATGSVYHGSPAHISRPLSASARADAVSTCIGNRGKPMKLISSGRMVVLCAETSTVPRLCAQDTYQGMLFRTAFCRHRQSRRRSEGSGIRFFAGAQNDSVPSLP